MANQAVPLLPLDKSKTVVSFGREDSFTSSPPDTNSIKSWPTSPKPIQSSLYSIISSLEVDLLLFAFSLAFFIFGIFVASYDQALVEFHPSMTNALLEASKYGPSVLPILFACIVGRATHAVLVWRLEKGACVGTLDLLAGSTSFTSVVTSQFQMRILSVLGLILLAVWSMSPIGGQASLRQVTVGNQNFTEPASFTYMVPTGNMVDYDTSDADSWFAIINTLLVSSVLAPRTTKLATLDTWDNIKIPMIEYYEKGSTADEGGWYTTDPSENVYSSLVGLPMSPMNDSSLYYARDVQTQYLHLDCPVLASPSKDPKFPQSAAVGAVGFIWSNKNYTLRSEANPDSLAPRNFSVFTYLSAGTGMQLAQCLMTTTYVEVEMSCNTSSTCDVARMRRSQLSHPPPGYTLLDHHESGGDDVWDMFSTNFVNSMLGHSAYPTAVTNYLISPLDPLKGLLGDLAPDMALPSKEMYAVRLGQLFNTYWTSINAMYAITGGMTPTTAFMQGTNTSGVTAFFAKSSTTTGTKTKISPIIESHAGWVAALLIASTIMMIASLIPPIIRSFFSHNPDLMLNISSLAVRNNPYVTVPSSGTYMHASERAKLLKNAKIRFGDVLPDRDVGRLEIASIDPPGPNFVGRVRKDRLYE